MQTEKKIYIGLAVLAVIAGLLYFQHKRSTQIRAEHTIAATSANLPAIKVPDADLEKVSKVVIKDKQAEEVVLEKRGDEWRLTKPMDALASQQNVKSMLDNLKELQVTDAINDTPAAPAMYKDYDLDGDKVVYVQAFKGDKGSEKVFEAYFGKSGSRGQMARVGDKPGIWVVKGYSSYQFTRQVKDWREKSILKFEDNNAVAVTISNANGEFSFSKNGEDWSATFNKKKIDRFDPEKVKDMLRAFRALNAENFADDKNDKPAETGLGAKPVAVVTIGLKDDAGTLKIFFGNTSSGSSRYAKKDKGDLVYVIGSWASDWAVAKPEKFQKPDEKDKGKDKGKGDKPSEPDEAPPNMMPPMPEGDEE
jgi:hypothetical protein